MKLEFTKQVIEKKQEIYLPCEVPAYPRNPQWKNKGAELYIEQFGQAEFDRRIRQDYPMPMPDDSYWQRRKLDVELLQAKLMFGYKALMTGRRATHMRGQGARGTLKIVDKPEFPEHDFFEAGKEFECRIRHANASFYDDACTQVRSCSLKFANSDYESPLDVLMNSGPTSAFWNLKTFLDFSNARVGCSENNWDSQKKWMKSSPAGYIGTIDAVRHAPSSFTSMTYYSKIAFPFKARDGKIRYVKYRIEPCDLVRESGLISTAMQRQPWVQSRMADDGRPREYLRQEYQSRLKKQGKIEYKLQIQVRPWEQATDTAEFFNMNREWNEKTWPWMDLAEVRITNALPDEITERMGMWLGHHPPSLGLTDAYSPLDYRSLCWARPQVYPISRMNRSAKRMLNIQNKLPKEF